MEKYKNIFRIGSIALFLVLISLAVSANTNDSIEIKKVMSEQENAWNNGDLDGFMQGYWKNDQLKFISKNGVTYGWQNIYNNYKKSYPNKETMGTLTFDIISIEPLGYMRGRTFTDTLIIADEMQNSTPNQMKMLLTRIGEGTKLIVTGDLEQSDLGKDNGLENLIYKMQCIDLEYITHVEMGDADIVRHPAVKEILKVLNS